MFTWSNAIYAASFNPEELIILTAPCFVTSPFNSSLVFKSSGSILSLSIGGTIGAVFSSEFESSGEIKFPVELDSSLGLELSVELETSTDGVSFEGIDSDVFILSDSLGIEIEESEGFLVLQPLKANKVIKKATVSFL